MVRSKKTDTWLWLIGPPILIEARFCKYNFIPGMPLVFLRNELIMASIFMLLSFLGLRTMKIRPVLPATLGPPAPILDIKLRTFGS